MPPDPTAVPDDRRRQNTLYAKASRPNLHMYRQPKGAAEYPMVAFAGAFARASTAARVKQLVGA